MTFKTLIAAAVAAAFALPFSASAAGDKADKAASSSDKSAPSGATKSDGGAEAMFKALDKNNDGFMSKEEVKGTPHDKDFSTLDKNDDGKLSPGGACRCAGALRRRVAGSSRSQSKKPESSSKPAESSSKPKY